MAVLPILAVKNYDASVKFYTEQLGFVSEFTMQGPDGTNSFGFVSKGEARLGLGQQPDVPHAGHGVYFMLYPEGDFDIDAYYAQVQQKGVPIAEEIKTEYWGDRVFSLKDPDGYHLAFGKTVQEIPLEQIKEHMRQPA
jgi:uncharacterized glyoxalase superfamily protein PhnB